MSFVHLHVHTHYSLLEATATPQSLAQKAKELEMPAVALTDNGNMFGAIEFYFAALDAGIKPIIGLEVYLAPGSRFEKKNERDNPSNSNRRLVLLAQDYQGYQNLCQISTKGYQEGFYYKPRVDFEVLRDHGQNIIALSGGKLGEIPWSFINEGPESALKKVREFKNIFGDNFYLEMNRPGTPEWLGINQFLSEAARITGVPLIAAGDVYYLNQDDQIAQEVLVCIGTNKTLHDETRPRMGSNQFYLKSPPEMQALFHDLPQACEKTLEVAERCNIKFKLKNEAGKAIYHFPDFTTADGRTSGEEIRILAEEGLEKRFAQGQIQAEGEARAKYHARLEFELGVIDKMGFNGYFLIVQDFINWAKRNGIPVGPGRGSGAGSLVAFSLRITDLDPLAHDLVFERFLNPERISMPDFDIDLCQEGRQRVIEYVTQKYGKESVSQIITYGKLMARIAVRDVGRVLGMTYTEVDAIAKLIPPELNITLARALEMEPRLKELVESDPQVATLLELAQKIEGLVRHAGIHAAGVVIADRPLVSYAPLCRGTGDETVVQYDMKHAEKIGLIKFDFLGLKTLTHIKDALELVEKNRGKQIRAEDIPLTDTGIYDLMSRGDTAGVFQFEGEGITDTVVKIRPNCFADITAINALYRPGPMDMIPEYTACKHGEKEVVYLFPELEPILKETYGVVVVQEQVMLIAAKIANYSLGEADLLRRAMGKKIASEMEKQRTRFLEGAKKNNYDLQKAEELFDRMSKFAEYGFNKSHAAAYCVIAAQTAWLKNYYPVEFYAALLTTEISSTDKIVKYIKDAKKHNVEVAPPHINHSEYKFTVKGNTIYFGLGAIKGVGEAAVEAIIEARHKQSNGKFENLDAFFEGVDLRRVNKKVIECLIKAGALDGFGFNRATLYKGYSQFLERAESTKKDLDVGQASLFSLMETSESSELKVTLENCEEWSRAERLAHEKETLGFYLSDHPLNGMEFVVRKMASGTIEHVVTAASANPAMYEPGPSAGFGGRGAPGNNFRDRMRPGQSDRKKVAIVGIFAEMREIITKKGTRMAFAQIEDLTGAMEAIIVADSFAKFEFVIKQERPVLVMGSLEIKEGVVRLLVETVVLLEECLLRAKHVRFKFSPMTANELAKLKSILQNFPGEATVSLALELDDLGKNAVMRVGEPHGICPSAEFFETMRAHFGRTDFIELL